MIGLFKRGWLLFSLKQLNMEKDLTSICQKQGRRWILILGMSLLAFQIQAQQTQQSNQPSREQWFQDKVLAYLSIGG